MVAGARRCETRSVASMCTTRTLARLRLAALRQTLPTRPGKRSIPRKFRRGFRAARATRKVPSPQPASISTGPASENSCRKSIGPVIEYGTNSMAASRLSKVLRLRIAILECVAPNDFVSLLMKRLALLLFLVLSSFLPAEAAQTRTAVFAGGCFWCIQPAFDKAPGVIKTVVGYTGGVEPDPTYELVSSEKTKYRESIEITYDATRISYDQLLDIY